ncbi:hypothetical protein BOTBODRAFT_488559 [Botryobasidium botryosum FD-172 SS1]|uniref:Uncharacterized protein n=1 Tax=Botryobasidium botryosum (strain FD-172 SS1) TaxID=930990 RepID=A0A067MGK3_BOTB1|nr:hypothetical protein BOTBODRAFT_488559 [Botryobasidium botryosum FD-172 SS1]
MSLYDLSTGAASVPHDNVHSMTVKSSVLLQRATDLKLRAEAKNLGDSFWTESLALENVILHFAASVPLVPSLGTEPGPAGGAVSGSLSLREASTIWINMLNLTALMQLHAAFALDDPVARQKCLSSLEKIIRLARLVEDSDPRYLQAVEIPLRLTHGFLCQIIDRCREDGDAEGLREYEPMQEFLVRVVTALAPNHILRRPPPTWSI